MDERRESAFFVQTPAFCCQVYDKNVQWTFLSIAGKLFGYPVQEKELFFTDLSVWEIF